MLNDFQGMAISNESADPMEKRVVFAEKLRKAKKSDILKGKRDGLKRKAVDIADMPSLENADEVVVIGSG